MGASFLLLVVGFLGVVEGLAPSCSSTCVSQTGCIWDNVDNTAAPVVCSAKVYFRNTIIRNSRLLFASIGGGTSGVFFEGLTIEGDDNSVEINVCGFISFPFLSFVLFFYQIISPRHTLFLFLFRGLLLKSRGQLVIQGVLNLGL